MFFRPSEVVASCLECKLQNRHILHGRIMDTTKARRKRRRSHEAVNDEFVDINVNLLQAKEFISSRQQENVYENEHFQLTQNPNDGRSDDLRNVSTSQHCVDCPSTSQVESNSNNFSLEEIINDNEDTIETLLSDRDNDFDDLWSHIRDELLTGREEAFKDESTGMNGEEDDEDVWFDVEENFLFTESPGLSACHNTLQGGREETSSSKEETDIDQEPLYKGANVTLGSVMVLLVLFVIRHNLTSEALENLLSIIAAVLPASSILPSSLNRFKKYFSDLKHPFVFHHYCSFCFAYVGQRNVKQCPNLHCLKDLTAKGGTCYFIEIPIINQLQTMFSRSGFYNDLQHRFHRKKQALENIEDIYDGGLYRSLVSKGILSSGNNISFIFNTDGVPVFKSSKVSIWPLYLIIERTCFLPECGLEKKSQRCGHS